MSATTQPFFDPPSLPYQYPPFDVISDGDYLPAFERGMKVHEEEVASIISESEAPSFENTVVALERSGRLLERVAQIFYNVLAANGNEAMQEIEAKVSPQLTAHLDGIFLNDALFQRVKAVYDSSEKGSLDEESQQLLERYYQRFLRNGAKLSQEDKDALKAINQELSSLSTLFRQRVLGATQAGAVVVDKEEELEGLSAGEISSAEQAAKARGLDGKWLLVLQNTTQQPVLASLSNRALRKRVYESSVSRNDGGDFDTTEIIVKVLKLRAEKAKLLSYENFSAYTVAEETAGNTAEVERILRQVAGPALKAAKKEAKELQALMQKDLASKGQKDARKQVLEPWDWAYYEQKLREEKFDYKDSEVRPYFELERVLHDGVFYAASVLYDLRFVERHDLPVYADDVRVFEVFDGKDEGKGVIVLDFYKRDSKQGGAWMDNLVAQNTLLNEKPVIINNLNVQKPEAGKPTLLTFDEVTTMFHEFGHLLHGLLSEAKYPLLSGTNVPRDFVEFPSQFNEMWARDPGVLKNMAIHFETGEAMPEALLKRVLASQTAGTGYATLEYVKAAMLDLAWHELAPEEIPAKEGVFAFEKTLLEKMELSYDAVPPRYHSPYFQHIFSSGYASAYYAYMWSEVLARDAGAWFTKNGGLSRENGKVFSDKLLSRGRTKEPGLLFQDFYGDKPDIQPLLDYRGLN